MTPRDAMKKTAEGQVSAPVLRGVTLVLGSPFSGSTLLGQSLNDIVGIAYAGELDRMHWLGFGMHIESRHHESRCDICTSHEGVTCPVFGDEDESVVADGGAVGLDVYLEVLSRFGQPYVGLILGERCRWVQVLEANLLPLEQLAGDLPGEDVRGRLMLDQIQDHGDGLLECTSSSAFAMLPASITGLSGKLALEIVFRPILPREAEGTAT